MNTGENVVALKEQHNGMCSMSKLRASCLSLVLSRKIEKKSDTANVVNTVNVNSKRRFSRPLFKIYSFP